MNKRIVNIALFIICIFSIVYAFGAYYSIVINDEFSKNIKTTAIKLLNEKHYYFLTKYKIPDSLSVNVYIENKNVPDSLCVMYYDKEWKLKLNKRIRKNDEDTTRVDIFYPWCCTQGDKPIFKDKNSIIPYSILSGSGIKFNHHTGSSIDRFSIRIDSIGTEKYLKANLQYIGKIVPLSRNHKNIVELDYGMKSDSVETHNHKYIYSFPVIGGNVNPSIEYLIIDGDNVSIKKGNVVLPIKWDNGFDVNNIRFELYNSYDNHTKVLLGGMYLFLTFFTGNMFRRLIGISVLKNNLIAEEQSLILRLRILFNALILMGSPLLLLQTKYAHEGIGRLYLYVILVLLLNINWSLFLKCSEKTKHNITLIAFVAAPLLMWWHVIPNHEWQWLVYAVIFIYYIVGFFVLLKWSAFSPNAKSSIISLSLSLFFIAGFIAIYFMSNSERLWGIPVLHVAKVLYIMLPFTFFILIEKHIRIGRSGKILNILKGFGLGFILLCCFVISLFIGFKTKDLATPSFTALALIMIVILHVGIDSIFYYLKNNPKKFWLIILFLLIVSIGVWLSIVPLISLLKSEKLYRAFSSWIWPDEVSSTIYERTKETVAQLIYLIKLFLSRGDFLPEYNINIPPSWRTVFFSDYAVTWSVLIGGYLYAVVYLLIMTTIIYNIVNVLVLLNKQIVLQDRQVVVYGKRFVLISNILLSLLLVQYVYTLMSGLWVFPVTGQSPGLLCPSIFEVIFHVFLINYLYIFLGKKTVSETVRVRPVAYSKVLKQNRLTVHIFIFLCGLLIVIWMIRILNHRNVHGNDELIWKKYIDTPLASSDDLYKRGIDAYMFGNINDFKLLVNKYYKNNDSVNEEFSIDLSKIDAKIKRDDSCVLLKSIIPTTEGKLEYYRKIRNGEPVTIIFDKYYSGFPVSSTTINYNLQRSLNQHLELWADSIKKESVLHGTKNTMLAGSIIVIENGGAIKASASYPFFYNENIYHLRFVEEKDFNKTYKSLCFQDNGDCNYINYAEAAQMPGSIVKPLLLYAGLSLLKTEDFNRVSKMTPYEFIGRSDSLYARKLFQKLYDLGLLEQIREVFFNDFGIKYYSDLKGVKVKPGDYKGWAIGQMQPIPFINIVQAYARINMDKKIITNYKYSLIDNNKTEKLSLDQEKLKILFSAMNAPIVMRKGKQTGLPGTALSVGDSLVKRGIDISSFIAKTGTAEAVGNGNTPVHNVTSSFILTTDKYTIGVQLFGDLPDKKMAARLLFIDVIKSLHYNGVL